MAKQALIKQGYEVVDFSLTKPEIFEYTEVLTTLALNYVLMPSLKILDACFLWTYIQILFEITTISYR